MSLSKGLRKQAGAIRWRSRCGNPWPRLRFLVEVEDDLVRPNQPKLLAGHFIGKVGIGMLGIEQGRPVTQLVTLLLDLRQLLLASHQRVMIAAPRQQPVVPGDRMSGKGADDDQRQRRHRRPPYQSITLRSSPHD